MAVIAVIAGITANDVIAVIGGKPKYIVILRPSTLYEAEGPAFDKKQRVLRCAQDDRLFSLLPLPAIAYA
ncbi:MAG: hypothetical protein JOY79_11745 [Acidobacteriaceae bacterium]|nr:hypothetical protein [Acidobacteriaceae bacterium]